MNSRKKTNWKRSLCLLLIKILMTLTSRLHLNFRPLSPSLFLLVYSKNCIRWKNIWYHKKCKTCNILQHILYRFTPYIIMCFSTFIYVHVLPVWRTSKCPYVSSIIWYYVSMSVCQYVSSFIHYYLFCHTLYSLHIQNTLLFNTFYKL